MGIMGIFLIMGHAGLISSTVGLNSQCEDPRDIFVLV